MALRDDIQKYYPNLLWAIDNPALRDLLTRAVASEANGDGGWDAAKFTSELQQTDWWKNTLPADREFQQRLAQDPAQNAQRRGQRQANIWDKSRELGVNLDGNAVTELANNAERMGWNDNQIVDQIVEYARRAGYQGTQGNLGGISNSIAELKRNASSFYVTIDDNTAFQWATQIANGERKPDDFNQVFKDWAKAKFSYDPQTVKRLDEGFTPEQLFQPQKNTVAKLLEVDPSTINLNDPKYGQILDYADPATGQRRSMTEPEAAKFIRGTAEWQKTSNGQAAGANMVGKLTQMFQGR